MKKVLAIAGKDLRADVRGSQIVVSMILFALVLTFLFTFAFPPGAGRAPVPVPRAGAVASREIAGVFLWAGLLFAAILGFGRSAAMDTEGGRIEALLMAPVDPAALFAGKALANATALVAMEAVVVPAFILFFDTSPALLFPEFLLVLLLADIGLAATGTLFAAASQYARVREVILPLLAFPILLPVVLGAAALTTSLLVTGGIAGQTRWLVLLSAFDLSITAVGAVAFEYVITE